MKTGTDLIAEERARQIAVEGWTPEHDQQHSKCELTSAAISYATYARDQLIAHHPDSHLIFRMYWPWARKQWKPDVPIRNLVKAGALIAAEIDRLQRA